MAVPVKVAKGPNALLDSIPFRGSLGNLGLCWKQLATQQAISIEHAISSNHGPGDPSRPLLDEWLQENIVGSNVLQGAI